MNKRQIVRTIGISAAILVVVIVLDYLINVVIAPGHTPYTPFATMAIVLAVAPPFTAYLILQHAKVQQAQSAFAEERVARLAADGANEAKTLFLANMSHELRTPLNAIIGYAEILQEDAEADGKDGADAQRIHRSAHHLLSLINDILDHARLETGKLELRRSKTPLAPVFHEIAESIRPLAAENGNALDLDCPDDIGEALVDPVRLKQCMLNLASNAAKFTQNGRITLRMRAIGADQIQFEAADTGIGMTEDTVSRLFKPFVQADTSITRIYGGAGLGLAITKQLIESMGGKVSANSVYGAGSTFTLQLSRGASATAQTIAA